MHGSTAENERRYARRHHPLLLVSIGVIAKKCIRIANRSNRSEAFSSSANDWLIGLASHAVKSPNLTNAHAIATIAQLNLAFHSYVGKANTPKSVVEFLGGIPLTTKLTRCRGMADLYHARQTWHAPCNIMNHTLRLDFSLDLSKRRRMSSAPRISRQPSPLRAGLGV